MKRELCKILCLFLLIATVVSCSAPTHGQKKRSQRVKTEQKSYSSVQIYNKCNPAVFTVYASDGYGSSQGSGFFINSSGLAVSNYHVFEGTNFENCFIKTHDGKIYKLKKIVNYSQEDDIFVFVVNTAGSKVTWLPMSNRRPVIGQKVYAIGSPKGFDNTLSSGEISQLRGVDNHWIQINVPIDHGSSGGALINQYCEVIGITSGGVDTSNANLNVAINIAVAKKYISQKSSRKKYQKKKRR